MINEPLSESMLAILNMSRKEFIETNKEYLQSIGKEYFEKETVNKKGKTVIEVIDPMQCPLHLWHLHNETKRPVQFVALTATCPLCNQPMCPDCANHNVHQLSRVTGYMSNVDEWNAAKQQEYKDRMRYQT